jgi:6-phosphofructokinase 1
MEKLIGRAVFAQSGGPTAVINSSIAGGLIEALNQDCITDVLCAVHGIKGVLTEDFVDIGKEDLSELYALKNTPASEFGSVRYKLKDFETNEEDYKKILEVFKKYDIKYFFYNGGNDSMDTCNKISRYMEKVGYPIRVIGIPKTIDNDLAETDHCPGYGSAAKYIATTVTEIYKDAVIYESPLVIILEIMGRNAGWLTASAALASLTGYGADLIYLPEIPFSIDKFKSDVKKVTDEKRVCIVAVSEGIKNADGKYVGEDASATDVFGHSALGGVCGVLKTAVKNSLPESDIPAKLVIVSDMEFDACAENASLTNFQNAKKKFEAAGYKLPDVVFWNVASRNRQQPVTKNEQGVALVSGCTPRLFSMIASGTMNPYAFMLEVVESERYAKIVA